MSEPDHEIYVEPDGEIRVPVTIQVGNITGELGEIVLHPDPAMWRPRLAEFLRSVADEIEQPTGPDIGGG